MPFIFEKYELIEPESSSAADCRRFVALNIMGDNLYYAVCIPWPPPPAGVMTSFNTLGPYPASKQAFDNVQEVPIPVQNPLPQYDENGQIIQARGG